MFTVIICDEKIIKDCEEKYSLFLSPLLSGDFAFCKWNPEGATPDEIIPDIARIVRNIPEWRAVVVLSEEIFSYANISKRNPFDYTEFKNLRELPQTAEGLKEYRESKLNAYNLAALNPLLRLACWLCEPSVKEDVVTIDPEIEKISEEPGDDYRDQLLARGTDVYSVESDIYQKCKYEVLSKIWKSDMTNFNLPKQVVCISERHYDCVRENADDAWKHHDEFEYRDFIEPNLYPAKLRFLLYDVNYCNKQRKTADYINFLSVLLIFAANSYPIDAVKAYRVYKISCSNDHNMLSRALSIYDTKLSCTQDLIKKRMDTVASYKHAPITQKEFEEKFLVDYDVNVQDFEETDTKDIMASNAFVQLVTDKPQSEHFSWAHETKESKKAFVKFLKEPRRAVKRAADETRKTVNVSTDDIFYLNDFQVEDIEEKIDRNEQEMVSVRTKDIYDTEAYKKRIDMEARRVEKHISIRMTARVAAVLTAVALGSYLAGYLPLFFSSLNSAKSIAFSAVVTLCAVALLGVVGFAAILFYKYKLKKDVKNYNFAMTKMIGELRALMALFGKYLTHLKGFMIRTAMTNRLSESRSAESAEYLILKKHFREIDEIRTENRLIFVDYSIYNMGSGFEPYRFDYTIPETYKYSFPYEEIGHRTISFVQNGNMIDVPIDFISDITVCREELYE